MCMSYATPNKVANGVSNDGNGCRCDDGVPSFFSHLTFLKRPLQCVRVEASISQLTHIKPTYIAKCVRANPMFGVRKLAYNRKMTKQELIDKAGSRKALAELLGISLAAISQWTFIPRARLWQLKNLRPEWFNP